MNILTLKLCSVSVVVGVDAELEESSFYDMDAELDELRIDDVKQTEDIIVSQWNNGREVSADVRHQVRDKVDEIIRPLGYETSLVVIRRANSLALCFICMTLSALMSLRDQWCSRQLRRTVEEIFTFLSHATETVRVRRLTWPLADYQRCLNFFSFVQG